MVGRAWSKTQLPSHPAIAAMLRGQPGRRFSQDELATFTEQHGYRFAPGSLSTEFAADREEWRFALTAERDYAGETLTRLSSQLLALDGVEDYRVTDARRGPTPVWLPLAEAGRSRVPADSATQTGGPSPLPSASTPSAPDAATPCPRNLAPTTALPCAIAAFCCCSRW
jgi:hypothetical protein